MRNRIKKINNNIYNPIKCQTKVFNYLIRKGIKTKFGKEHQFNRIYNYDQFKKQVPIRKYEQFTEYISKIKNGEKDVLWPGKMKFFAKSSGTTNNKSKYIPITKESLHSCHFKAGKDMLSIYENNFSKNNIYNGKGLMLGGSIQKSKTKKIIIGDLSAILIKKFPFWVNYHRVPDKKTALMHNWDQKLEKIAKQAVNENITNITGVPSWMLILLKRILKISGKKNIVEVWPNIELYIHGGINFAPYKKQFEQLIPRKKMNYLEGYNASEGFFGIQDKTKSKGMLLMLDYGVFYEFIPMHKYRQNKLEAIDLSNVEINTNYALVITTNAGLWRYLIGDVVEFTSISPYRIKIIGRTKSYINTFGEELMIHNTDKAIDIACQEFNCIINEYMVAPIHISKKTGGHEWFIEFVKQPENLTLFMHELDFQIKNLNSDYEAKRYKNLILRPPKLVVIENNEFYIWLKENNRLGGQYKIPRLTENRVIADRIIKIKKKFSTKPNTNLK